MTNISPIIISCLKTYYLIEVEVIHLLPLGADVDASVYKVQSSDRKSYFVKVKRGHFDDVSAKVLELLQSAGVREIIFPIKTIGGDLVQKLDDLTFIVYPFVEGQDGFSRPLNPGQWIQLGKIMRQIHDIKVPPSIQNRIRKEDFSSEWRGAVRSFYRGIEEMKAHDATGIKLLRFLREHKAVIEQIVNRAKELSQKMRHRSLQFVLCHSDIHGGNVLLGDNDTFYIVDWDDPIMAPKERDLMFMGGGVGNVWNMAHEEELFYQGYGDAVINKTALAYYRFERIVVDIVEYIQVLLLSEEGHKDREQMYMAVVDMFKPQGVVDIAFKTQDKLMG